MQAQRSDDETAAIDFAAQLKKVMADPSVEGLQALKKTYEALSEAAKGLSK